MDVAEELKSEKCFANIAGNVRLWTGTKFARGLFEVARTHPDIVTGGEFCVLANSISTYALPEHLRILDACKVRINAYPAYAIADRFQREGYMLEGTGIDPKNYGWSSIQVHDDLGPKLKQRLWLALVAVVDQQDDVPPREQCDSGICILFLAWYGLNIDSSAPLTEVEIQIIRLLPAAIEYAMNRIVFESYMTELIDKGLAKTYKALKRRVANYPELSNYLYHRFFLNLQLIHSESCISDRKH